MTEQAASAAAAIWVEVIRVSGQLAGTVASVLFFQYVYATFIADKPDQAWLTLAYRWLEREGRARRERAMAWINDPRSAVKPAPRPTAEADAG